MLTRMVQWRNFAKPRPRKAERILAFTHASRVTLDVGFYYMSNAAGRLVGTFLSGASYQFFGLAGCLATAGLFAGLSWLLALRLEVPAARPA